MGNKAGWLALYAGIAGGGDVVLIPEIPYDVESITSHLERRTTQEKPFSIVVVAEGALSREEAALGKKERRRYRESTGFTTIGYRLATGAGAGHRPRDPAHHPRLRPARRHPECLRSRPGHELRDGSRPAHGLR